MAFLQVNNLNKSHGALDVLKNLNLEVEEGGFLVLLGPSGSGKTSLLHTIAGLEKVTSGQIHINGRDVTDVAPAERDIAMVFQNFALYPNMTVANNISFGLEMRQVPKRERETAVSDVARLLKINQLLDRYPHQLSGGQRQRVSMGRAMVRNPQVFLFDEPLTNLDAKLRIDMRTEIKRLHKRLARTMVYVTHDQVEAMSLATKIAIMKDGVLQQVGTPSDIYNNPTNLFVADFMGSPAMNLIKARLSGSGDAMHLLVDRSGLEPLQLPVLERHQRELRSRLGEEIILGVRPEWITDHQSKDHHSTRVSHIDCLIEVLEPAGADTFAVTKLGGKEVFCRLPTDTQSQVGQIVSMRLQLEKIVYFDPDSQARII